MFSRCSRMHTACALLALSGATRSNGILNLAYIGYVLLLNVYEKYNRVTFLLRKVLECGTYLLLGVTPFCVFQAYSYFLYCKSVPESMPVALEIHARSRGYVHLHEEYRESSWCSDTLPIPYSFIQRSHWDVGFLRYYELKQIPNFILALPILSLSSWSVCRLGVDEETGSLLPYLLHLTALVIVCLFFVHVQVRLYFCLRHVTKAIACLLIFQFSTVSNSCLLTTPQGNSEDRTRRFPSNLLHLSFIPY